MHVVQNYSMKRIYIFDEAENDALCYENALVFFKVSDSGPDYALSIRIDKNNTVSAYTQREKER